MPATHTIRRHCCPHCGGRRVETLDWVTVNGDEFVGGDLAANFWCPDCESHPEHIDYRTLTLELCLICSAHSWGTRVPLPGVWTREDGSVERCELCDLYPSHLAAAHAVSLEFARRGGTPRIAVRVEAA